ncbi:MAG TPA: C25 family cysteine peptidase [Candidatus Krumholzibacteria bacterium]
MRTSLLRFALALCFSTVSMTTASAVAGQMTWPVNTSRSDISITGTTAGDRVVATGAEWQDVVAPGAPVLPFRIVRVLLGPAETVASFAVDAGTGVTLAANYTPVIAPLADPDAGPAAGAAPRDYSQASAELLGVGHLHGYTIASFAVYPLRIRDGELVLNESITLRITTGPDASGIRVAKRLRARADLASGVEEMLGGLVVNPASSSVYPGTGTTVKKPDGGFQPTSFPSLEGSDVDYVIITNDSLASTFQTLADWKTAKGVPTVVRTTEWIDAHYRNGADPAETIRSFILDAYQDWGITYVLLGGDTDQIPVRLGRSTYLGVKELPADMYFACLDGDWNLDHDEYFGEPNDVPDLYPEVYLGRLPAVSNATAATLIGKIESYETPVHADYTGSALMLAEVLFPIDWTQGMSVSQDGADIAEYLYLQSFTGAPAVARYYENYIPHPGSLPEDAASAIAAMNAGYDQVNHTGHGFRFNMSVGNGSVVNADADALTNTDRYSNMFLLNCTAVAITYFCIGEHFLINPNGGAVSVIGSSESVYPLIAQPYMNEYYRLLYNVGVRHIGEAFTRSKYPRTPLALAPVDNADLYTHYVYNMLADPEMEVWTGAVLPLTVTFPASIGMGTTQVAVHVTDAGGAVAGAQVCLSKDDDDYEVGTTDASGNVTLAMTAESAGSVRIVATARNHGRFDSTIAVSQLAGAYVSFESEIIDDDATGGTVGNADTIIDAGETIDFKPRVRNSGGLAASNVTLSIHSDNPGVTFTDSLATAGNVGPGAVVTAADPFRMAISSSLADKTPVKFTLTVRQNGVPVWIDRFSRVVHAPGIEFAVLRINDSGTGNGDGVIQAGETFRLYYRIKNFGTGAARAVNATLVDLSGGVFVLYDNSDAYGSVASLASPENTDGFLLKENDVSVSHNLRLDVTDAAGHLWQKTFELRRPDAPLNILFDTSLGPDRLQLTWDPPATATDVERYVVYRSGTPGGPYDVASVDAVRHTLLLDRGLYPTTRYYYRLSSVDVSGNESPLSAELSASTNPAQVEGWPISMAAETVSSPVVGDIDGDNDFELVEGDSKVYAWHDDGHEVRDGDGNAQTWGLFSTQGNSFVSHIALADVDNVNGLDILAASRDTKQVFAFSYTGNVIAGWPRPVLNVIRAGVVAGDIDGDGNREIIAIDEKGVLYAWHRDGSEVRNGDNDASTSGVFRKFSNCTYQYGCPATGDLDGDGINELVVGTQGDSVFVLKANGTTLPGWPKGYTSDVVAVALGDVDDDGSLDVVVHEMGGFTRVLRANGALMWERWASNNLSFSPSPALGDLDGDGKLEVVVPSKDRKVYAIKWNGTDVPGWPVTYAPSSWTESSPVIADIDNNGSLDVVLGNELKFINGWDAAGQTLAGFPLAMSDAVRATPCIADLDKDGDVDVIAAGWDKSVRVWDFPKLFNPHMAPWAKYHANLYNDGNIATPLPTPVGGARFTVAVSADRLDLAWFVDEESRGRFSVERADIVAGVASPYRRIASSLVAGSDGAVRLADSHVEMGARYAFRLLDESGTILDETAGIYVPVSRAGLGQNFPNPFNPATHIDFWVPDGGAAATPVRLDVYDVRGARVRTLVDGNRAAGRYRIEWDGRDQSGSPVGSGVYFYRMSTPQFSDTRKMLLLK